MKIEKQEKLSRPMLQILAPQQSFEHWINGMDKDKKKRFKFLVNELLMMDIEKPSAAKMAGYIEYIKSFVNS